MQPRLTGVPRTTPHRPAKRPCKCCAGWAVRGGVWWRDFMLAAEKETGAFEEAAPLAPETSRRLGAGPLLTAGSGYPNAETGQKRPKLQAGPRRVSCSAKALHHRAACPVVVAPNSQTTLSPVCSSRLGVPPRHARRS